MNENVICACRQQCQQHSRSNKANLDVSNAMAPLNTSSIDLKRVSTPQNGLSLLRFEPVVLENINSMFGRENAIRKRHRFDNSNCSYIPNDASKSLGTLCKNVHQSLWRIHSSIRTTEFLQSNVNKAME